MRSYRLAPYIAAFIFLAACGSNSPNGQQAGNSSGNGLGADTGDNTGKTWPRFIAPPSGRANQGVIVNGEFVGTDEIHFARGANADGIDHEAYYCVLPNNCPPTPAPTPVEDDEVYRHATWGAFGADRAAHNGDYLLPTDTNTWPDFTADIAFVRMQADREDLYVHIRFVSFPAPDAQIATITFTAENSNPALAAWPRNAGVSSSHDQALTLWGDGGELTQTGSPAVNLIDLGGAVQLSDHAFEARIPLTALPSGRWKVGVGSGLADPADASQYWTVPLGAPTATSPGTDSNAPPGANVWDLAFTPHDPNYHDDHIQADLLSAGDVSSAVISINPSDLQNHVTTAAPAITGRVAHTYQSAFDFGDGITRGSPSLPPANLGPMSPVIPNTVKPRDLAVSYEYTGAMQPYFAYIPSAYPSSSNDWPLVLYFHGLNNYIWEPFGLTLGLEDELEQRGYLFASLLGRGDISFTGRGELDPLEVIEHMAERYRIDRSRIYIVGHSHGAGGVMNVSRRNPDIFAGVVSAQIMDGPAVSENFLHLPTMHIAGLGDPIDNGNGASSRYTALSDLGYDSQAIIYTAKTHENSSIYDAIEQIFDLYDGNINPTNPATVVFSRAGGDFDEDLGLLHNGSYWVSNMVANDPAATMSIAVESFGIAHQPLDAANATKTQNPAYDSGGASGRSLGTHLQTVPAYGPLTTVSNTVTLTTSNLTDVTLDVSRMAIDLNASDALFTLSLDNPLNLSLTGSTLGSINWQARDASNAVIATGGAGLYNGVLLIQLPANATTLEF